MNLSRPWRDPHENLSIEWGGVLLREKMSSASARTFYDIGRRKLPMPKRKELTNELGGKTLFLGCCCCVQVELELKMLWMFYSVRNNSERSPMMINLATRVVENSLTLEITKADDEGGLQWRQTENKFYRWNDKLSEVSFRLCLCQLFKCILSLIPPSSSSDLRIPARIIDERHRRWRELEMNSSPSSGKKPLFTHFGAAGAFTLLLLLHYYKQRFEPS